MGQLPFHDAQIFDSRLYHVDILGLKNVSDKLDTTVRANVIKTAHTLSIDLYSGFSDNYLSFAIQLTHKNAPWILSTPDAQLLDVLENHLSAYISSLHFRWDEILYNHPDISAIYGLSETEQEHLKLYAEICHQYRFWYAKNEVAFSISDGYQIPGVQSDEAYINAYLEHKNHQTLFYFGICDYMPENEQDFLSIPYQLGEQIDLFQSPFYYLDYVRNFWDTQMKHGLSWQFIKHQIHEHTSSKASTITFHM